MSERYGYLLTVEEHYWNRFVKRNKEGKTTQAYVSSAGILKDPVTLIFFYSIGTHKDIVGYAHFIESRAGDTADLWDRFGQETCLNSIDEYLKVTRGKKKVVFIRFRNLHASSNIVALDQIREVLGIERMPQTGMYVSKNQAERLMELLE
jgi:predicted transcriptional regulator